MDPIDRWTVGWLLIGVCGLFWAAYGITTWVSRRRRRRG